MRTDHSFPRNFEPSHEFPCFHKMVQSGNKGQIQIQQIFVLFRRPQKINYYMQTWLRHEMHDLTATGPLTAGILLILNFSQILTVYLADRLYPSIVVTYQRQILLHIWLGSGGCRKLISICEKFAAGSQGIGHKWWVTNTTYLIGFRGQ